jgi:3-dehydroquinate dehydratase I
LKNAILSGCKFVDIEIESNPKLRDELIRFAKKNKCFIIVSMHDFKKTPSLNRLLYILEKQEKLNTNIIKIVTNAKTIVDCKKILELYNHTKKPLIAFCLGEIGKITRIVSLYYGAPHIYSSIKKQTANGQLNIKATKKIMEELDKQEKWKNKIN